MAEAPRRAVTQDDSLPPVEPPSAGFLVQLFLVPAVIVGIIVAVWIAFHWLAQLGNDPEGYLKALRRPTEGRWQAALNLANDLRGPGGRALKEDAALATQLAGILADEVASGRPRAPGYGGEQSRTLCEYLCRALGEFTVPEAAPQLVARAADVAEPSTARSAVEALAVLADTLPKAGRAFADPAAVTAAVLAASHAEDAALRARAAYTLGVLGGAGVADRLRQLLDDPDDNVRCNAAIGLSRQGRDDGMAQIAEMIARPDVAATPGDESVQAQRYRRVMIVCNALKGVAAYVDATASAPPRAVADEVRKLAADPDSEVRAAVAALLGKFDRVSSGAADSP